MSGAIEPVMRMNDSVKWAAMSIGSHQIGGDYFVIGIHGYNPTRIVWLCLDVGFKPWLATSHRCLDPCLKFCHTGGLLANDYSLFSGDIQAKPLTRVPHSPPAPFAYSGGHRE